MKTLTIIYLGDDGCGLRLRRGRLLPQATRPAAGTLGLIIAAIGLILIAWTGAMV